MLSSRILSLAILCALVSAASAGSERHERDELLDALSSDPHGMGVRYVSIETLAVPGSDRIPTETLSKLSEDTGIDGTEIVGVRIKIGLSDDFNFERLSVGVADGVFLVQGQSFFSRAGSFLLQVARVLLLGQLISVSTGLEIPAQSWGLLVGASTVDEGSVELHTKRELEVDRGDKQMTDHGEFVICRFILAANRLSELVDLRIDTRAKGGGDWLRYDLPRLELPGSTSGPTSRLRTVR